MNHYYVCLVWLNRKHIIEKLWCGYWISKQAEVKVP